MMNVVLWVSQGLLAALFLVAGLTKTVQTMAELSEKMLWVATTPEWVVRLAGVSEVLGALGVMLPAVMRIRPALSPLAAACLALVMALAMVFHIARGELYALPINLVLMALALFVAYGRQKLAPISPK